MQKRSVIRASLICRPLLDVGLVNNHAYSVLDVRELPGVSPGVQTTLADYSEWLATGKVGRWLSLSRRFLSILVYERREYRGIFYQARRVYCVWAS